MTDNFMARDARRCGIRHRNAAIAFAIFCLYSVTILLICLILFGVLGW